MLGSSGPPVLLLAHESDGASPARPPHSITITALTARGSGFQSGTRWEPNLFYTQLAFCPMAWEYYSELGMQRIGRKQIVSGNGRTLMQNRLNDAAGTATDWETDTAGVSFYSRFVAG